MRYLSATTLILLLTGAGQGTFAQTFEVSSEAASQFKTYEAEYFDAFVPHTAYDMVLRTPGFMLEFAEDRRGLGQGGANVLINGQRLTGKSNDPVEQLRRIPSSQVVRIELIDGASSGVPGLVGLVANIITRKSTRSGNWSWGPIFRDYVKPNWGRATASISGNTGKLDYALTLANTSELIGSRGPETRRAADGEILNIALEQFNRTATGPAVSGTLKWAASSQVDVSFNFEAGTRNTNSRELSTIGEIRAADAFDFSSVNSGTDADFGEVGGDVTFPFIKGQMKVTGLASLSEDDFVSRFERRDPAFLSASRFLSGSKETEYILRSEYDWGGEGEPAWQIAGEYAHNSLDFETELFTADSDGVFTSIELADPRTKVFEDRFETTLTHTRSLSSQWTLQAALGAEYSTLTQEDDVDTVSRSFFRPKGFAAFTYKANPSLTLNWRVSREVGQLNFLDFTSSVNFEDDLDQTGNPDLVPQQTWRGEFDLNKQFKNGHALQVTLFAEQIEDLVDRIPIGASGDGIGNIDEAHRYGASLSSTLKGDPWGAKGVEFNIDLSAAHSELSDPVEGFKRSLSNDVKTAYTIGLTHDIPNSPWAYGGSIAQTIWTPIFRINTVDQNARTPFASAYVEHKDVLGMKVRATVFNATDFSIDLDRRVFSGRRDQGALLRTESRSRSFNPFLQIEFTGTF